MKKLTALLLSAVLLLGLAACGSTPAPAPSSSADADQASSAVPAPAPAESTEPTDQTDPTTSAPAQTTAQTTEQKPTDQKPTSAATTAGTTGRPQSGRKTLVVYYSASGNTERVAKDIAAAAGADLFEIVPTEVYTSDDLNWTNQNSRVSREHDDESLRNVPLKTTSVANWADYDTVFIGYPIWWGIAAWPVDGFVKANDFTGKTVIPFATSSSSGMGQSGSLLAGMAKGGDWQEGQRFRSGASSADVQSWVKGLGL